MRNYLLAALGVVALLFVFTTFACEPNGEPEPQPEKTVEGSL
jgi:hypothetical protein